ncbi:hypothetical protein L1887_47149 [Cichorium endivia]|nr:hypothetical protein L1887_47149 [Cichorium endivia]
MYVEPRNLALDKLTLAILGSTAEMHFDQITMGVVLPLLDTRQVQHRWRVPADHWPQAAGVVAQPVNAPRWLQALRQAKARVSKFRANNAVDRVLRPNDVPGTLLNMAMLNITSDDSALRLSAYNLLCALSTSFNFGAKQRQEAAVELARPCAACQHHGVRNGFEQGLCGGRAWRDARVPPLVLRWIRTCGAQPEDGMLATTCLRGCRI